MKTNNKKSQLETQIENLKQQQPILQAELKEKEEKFQEVQNFHETLRKIERFVYDY
jgi:hypothetical protein